MPCLMASCRPFSTAAVSYTHLERLHAVLDRIVRAGAGGCARNDLAFQISDILDAGFGGGDIVEVAGVSHKQGALLLILRAVGGGNAFAVPRLIADGRVAEGEERFVVFDHLDIRQRPIGDLRAGSVAINIIVDNLAQGAAPNIPGSGQVAGGDRNFSGLLLALSFLFAFCGGSSCGGGGKMCIRDRGDPGDPRRGGTPGGVNLFFS